MDDYKRQATEHFQFPITPILQRKLNTLSKQANPDGEKVARWTDIILEGLNKLQPDDLVKIRRQRKQLLDEWARKEQVNDKTL